MKEINWAKSQNYILSPKVAVQKAELQQQSMSQSFSATATSQEAATSSAPQPQSEPRIASPCPVSKLRAAPKITCTKFPINCMPDSPIPLAQNTRFQSRVTSFSTDIGPYNHHSFLPTGFDFNASSPSAKAKQNKTSKTGSNPLFPPSLYQNIKNLNIQPNQSWIKSPRQEAWTEPVQPIQQPQYAPPTQPVQPPPVQQPPLLKPVQTQPLVQPAPVFPSQDARVGLWPAPDPCQNHVQPGASSQQRPKETPVVKIYSHELTQLDKTYQNEDKFSGTGDNLDFKLNIFYEKCERIGIPQELFGKAASLMLSGEARSYFFGHREFMTSWTDFIQSLQNNFKGVEWNCMN